jgi:hypothetical protein
MVSTAMLVALAGYGYWVAKAGRPLLGPEWLKIE